MSCQSVGSPEPSIPWMESSNLLQQIQHSFLPYLLKVDIFDISPVQLQPLCSYLANSIPYDASFCIGWFFLQPYRPGYVVLPISAFLLSRWYIWIGSLREVFCTTPPLSECNPSAPWYFLYVLPLLSFLWPHSSNPTALVLRGTFFWGSLWWNVLAYSFLSECLFL